MLDKTEHVKVLNSDTYNPETNNPRYSDNNRGDPKHHEKNSLQSGLMWFGELFQKFKRKYPKLSKAILQEMPLVIFYVAIICLASAIVALVAFYTLPVIIAASIVIGLSVLALAVAGMTASLEWLTTEVFGWSLEPFETIYHNAPRELEQLVQDKASIHLIDSNDETITCQYKTATGTLLVQKNKLPKLTLSAQSHKDSGYLEGYMQGRQIYTVLQQMNKVFGKIEVLIKIKQFFGAYKSDQELHEYMDTMLKNIPGHIVDEMRAKVDGYNQWLVDNNLSKADQLDFYQYFRLQLLPDIHNFNPFIEVAGAEAVGTGCTTIAYKVGEYTCYIRVLDWASHNMAGKACLEIERNIGTFKKTTDLTISILSGGASMVTNNGTSQMLTQINVAPVDADKKNEKGMPGAFAIRHLAETCGSVEEMKQKMEHPDTDDLFGSGPLSGMHISATDGENTLSFHAHQGEGHGAKHLLEVMGADRPMVVANFGYKDGQVHDFHDSSRRLENINRFFKDHPVQDIEIDGTQTENIQTLQEHMKGVMALDLVNNFESVFAGMYIFHQGNIIAAKAALDNNYAGSRALDEMMDLSVTANKSFLG